MIHSLPTALAERTRLLTNRRRVERGKFVLYWMHHAVRGHENPALDVALTLANRRRLPVVVYQGLGGIHPYNNDRHHTFILQGAHDAHAELDRLGVRSLFHLDTTGSAGSPLRELAVRAEAVVVEAFPAPPLSGLDPGICGSLTGIRAGGRLLLHRANAATAAPLHTRL